MLYYGVDMLLYFDKIDKCSRDGCQDATTATSPEYQEIDGVTNVIRP
jgi:hypothetical protein